MPIVEIATFEETGEAELDALLDGLRHRIAEDLSRFRVARIRLEPHTLSPSHRASRSEAADFGLKGVVISTSPTMLQISIIDRADDTLLWSKTTELPDDWKTYSTVMDDGIRSVVLQLVGARGSIASLQQSVYGERGRCVRFGHRVYSSLSLKRSAGWTSCRATGRTPRWHKGHLKGVHAARPLPGDRP
ncbi:MAG: hypothetical protein AAGE61_21540, partial [Pseudomonadota bacterium]